MNYRTVSGACLVSVWVALSLSCAAIGVQPWTGGELAGAEVLAAVDARVQDFVRENDVPGMSIAVVQHDSTLVLRGYGLADCESGTPATPDTIFRAYSISKVFTALETVQLAEEGAITLDATLTEVLPGWIPPLRHEESVPATVRHLLAHRSGLPRNSNYHDSIAEARADCLRYQVESMPSAWAAYSAGERYKYSNVGFNILGRIIELERDTPFAFYMTDVVNLRYGMTHSAFLLSQLPEESEIATGYYRDGSRDVPVTPYDIIGLASGNLFTSAADLAQFMSYVHTTSAGPNGTSLRTMFEPQYVRPEDPQRNGLGWMTNEAFMGELVVWHQGGDYDANAIVVLLPDSGWGFCALTNTGSFEGATLMTLARDVLSVVRGGTPAAGFGRAASPSYNLTTRSPTSPASAAGRYVAGTELITITGEDDSLRLKWGPATFRLEYEGNSDTGAVYSVHHWLDDLNVQLPLPVELSLVRVIVPAGSTPDHIFLAVSDISYDYCPRYPDLGAIPEGWSAIVGEYDYVTVSAPDDALFMSGVGFLADRESDWYEVLGGPYAGESVMVVPTGISHQGFSYVRK